MALALIDGDMWEETFSVDGIDVTGFLPYFPRLHPNAVDPDVPLPRLYTLKWTEPASTTLDDCDFPPTEEHLLSIPDPQKHPAHYSAAIDAIRLANDFFVKSGCGQVGRRPNGFPVTAEVKKSAEKFRNEYPDWPLPPDPRILWVCDKEYHPSDKVIP